MKEKLIKYVDKMTNLGRGMTEKPATIMVAYVDRLTRLGEAMTVGMEKGAKRIWRRY